ncbi:lipid scramblase CLPTM1L [Neodiprion pinetum]|uniref:Lipid scramblase CLPTM1L n=1 Tax=Neodiprion lecontei TaxID=441921 RepID=A0A6J0C5P5_NEOLC|nr:cleft lip and palate transmembrane protein 1-like protein [Neodiprion lecontei]XP_046436228.1 cleft lip and palate transmembrane protein 1-like protein [Neodiprion fabricii]XP_046483280.1 cleft lip and palate transmembrane protein 1-like protein [Neodiprion pinetum]XP_046625982.1 cleft lip and palate transmembrane protein 1-like protein [Neodiprion virginianus]
MKSPSLSLLLSGVFLGYIAYSIYTLSLLFVPPPCVKGETCLTSLLHTKPKLGLHMYVSTMSRPLQKELIHVYSEGIFDYSYAHDMQVTLPIPRKTRENGTLFLHLLITPHTVKHGGTYNEVIKDPTTVYTRIKMTQYVVPEIAAFNLLGDEKSKKNTERLMKPVSHLKSQVTFTMITDNIKLPAHNLPLELARDISITRDGMYLPIVNYDFLQTRHRDLVKISPQNDTMNVTVFYTPISIGKLRLILHVEAAMQGLKGLGFSDKDVDEVKGIFADTNVYLLGGTIFIAAVHLLFDFLAFKNDVSFWRGKNNLAGLSVRTVVWRAFSQAVIFLYLLDEQSSMLVLIPAGIGTIIEFWKSKKILRAEFVTGQGWLPRIKFEKIESSSAEERTRKFDAESMKYLSYLLYPLVTGGAVYSLLYQPHKSWYSWSINSLVNGVYAFGFLFMLPQLFVNYKLKSVAHLPWRAFMYKAFNTFIDDIFAFIITMPTAHRVACFRDDAVFLVYLYQRWLYPVDKSRRDDAVSIDETPMEHAMYDKKKN